MAVHWTDYPERVETFGDLISILETLDRHEMDAGFTAESFKNERGKRKAYEVTSTASGWRLRPHYLQMPRLDQLLDRFHIDGYPFLTLRQALELRREVARALNSTAAAVDALTFDGVLDALEVTHQPPAQPPAAVAPPPGEIKTFGEFLADVRAVEEAAASARAIADSMNGEPGTGHWRMQAAVFEATAAYREHPSFPHLEAHVNRLYGPFTHDNLLRARGEVCAIRHCGTTDADRLSVQEAVTALGCPGAPAADPPRAATSSRQVNTRPSSVEPPPRFVEAAMRALPDALNNAPQPQGVTDPTGRRGAGYAILRQRLEATSYNRDAVEWAIHRHVEASRLEAAPSLTSTPGVVDGGEWVVQSVTNHTYDRERCVLWATPALWSWWHELETAQKPANGASMSANGPAPAPKSADTQQPASYTMADIRDLLRYKRERAHYDEWCRSTFKPVLSVTESATRAHSLAFNSPYPSQLHEEVANTLAVYRRLLRESLAVLKRELDEQTLLYFVGEVADRHRRRVDEMWALSTEVFGCMMDEPAKPAAATTTPVEATPKADGTGMQESAATVQERKLTDRQKLILTEMLAMGAVGNTKKTTRAEVVKRIDKKKTAADLGRDFGVLKDSGYTDSEPGPEGGVWLTGKGKAKAEELNKENE